MPKRDRSKAAFNCDENSISDAFFLLRLFFRLIPCRIPDQENDSLFLT